MKAAVGKLRHAEYSWWWPPFKSLSLLNFLDHWGITSSRKSFIIKELKSSTGNGNILFEEPVALNFHFLCPLAQTSLRKVFFFVWPTWEKPMRNLLCNAIGVKNAWTKVFFRVSYSSCTTWCTHVFFNKPSRRLFQCKLPHSEMV